MRIFISWSGERSRAIAAALHEWLPKVLHSVKPWMSQLDISKGERWDPAISNILEAAKAGIICLTPSNLQSGAILFEAGAISKSVKDSRVYTLLAGVEVTELKWPLSQFQATSMNQQDVSNMLKGINQIIESEGEVHLSESALAESVEVWWPKLNEQLQKLPIETSTQTPKRSQSDLLEEILTLVRGQSRMTEKYLSEAIERAYFQDRTLRDATFVKLEKLQRQIEATIDSRQNSVWDEILRLSNGSEILIQHARAVAGKALEEQGHNTASVMIETSNWAYENGEIVVRCGLKKTMLGLTFNDEARRIIDAALLSSGLVKRLTIISDVA